MRAGLIGSAGVLMALSSIAHAFLGWPAMRGGLQAAGAPADLTAGLAIGWYFGSVTMAASGAILLVCWIRLRRGDRSGITFARVIAVTWFLFGTVAFVARGLNPHFLLFIALGCLGGLPTVGPNDEAGAAEGDR